MLTALLVIALVFAPVVPIVTAVVLADRSNARRVRLLREEMVQSGIIPATAANPLTLQLRKWGIVDFSKILKLRYKPD